MGISALKTVSTNIENSLRNWQETLAKQEFYPSRFWQYPDNIFEKRVFAVGSHLIGNKIG